VNLHEFWFSFWNLFLLSYLTSSPLANLVSFTQKICLEADKFSTPLLLYSVIRYHFCLDYINHLPWLTTVLLSAELSTQSLNKKIISCQSTS
jgi:hypothetical protein